MKNMNLKNRSFLTLLDYSPAEIEYLLTLSAKLKAEKKAGTEKRPLEGKNVVLIFEKDSTRTRCAFEASAFDLGMHSTYLGPSGSQMGKKESIKDTARVLGRMYDGIEYRGFSQDTVDILAEYSGVPVWNGLTDQYHPTQVLADLMTIDEHFGRLQNIKLAYFGDARYNMGNSLMIASSIMGLDFRAVAPKSFWPDQALVETCLKIAKQSGAQITLTDDVTIGGASVDVVYTDVWVSMGEPQSVWEDRIRQMLPYQVNADVMARAGKDVIFMHCLPAFHNLETKIGREIYDSYHLDALEVTEEVFESAQSVVFDEAENRLHTIKAVMLATLADAL
jgi:ornithine carbamoyltransferase